MILLEQCKRQQLANPKTAFVHEVSFVPELRCVMCYDDQLADIVRFCTNPNNFGILGEDPTFNPKTAFVHEVSFAPELRCVMCYDDQLADIVRFCTNPNNFGILGEDTTFNFGKFNVTVTAYTNLLVVDRKTHKHPVMIGPLFMHQTKTMTPIITKMLWTLPGQL